MHTLLRDVRLSLQLLWREKTFSATILTTLAVCIGANVAIYSVIHTVLLEPLPFEEPEELVTVFNQYPGAGAARAGAGTVDFFQRRAEVDAFEEVALYRGSGAAVGEAGSVEQVSSLQVTPSFFSVLGVEAARGRTFTEDEMEEGSHRKVLLTHGYWEERFGGAPDVVGRTLRVDREPWEVVGVLPEDFRVPNRSDVRFVTPTAFGPEDRDLQRWHSNNFQMMARLAPGASVGRAQAQIDALNERLKDEWPVPNARQLLEDAGFSTSVVQAGPDLVRDVEDVLYMLWAGVGLVLLIGCVNIANLMLARAQSRTGEVATKLALGAPRSRVAAQVLTEAVTLGVLGGILGLGVGWIGVELLRELGAADLPRGTEIAMDAPVILFTLMLAVGAGVLFGAIPVAQLMRGDLSPVFRTETRTGTASRRAVLLRHGLVTGQVALAFVLLIGAGLMLLSFRAALSVDPGFEPEGVLTGFVSLPEARYPDEDAQRQLWDRLLAEVEALPEVEAAGVANSLPFSGGYSSSVITPEGYVPRPGESLLSPVQSVVSPGYFQAMGIEVLEGRAFARSDGPDDLRVMVIDRWLADRYWPDGGAVGQRMVWGAVPGQDSIPEDALYTVIGVVETVKHQDLTAPAGEHVGAYYATYPQVSRSFLTLVARARNGGGEALTPQVREVLAGLDPELPLFDVQSMAGRIDESLARRRVPLVLLGVFAVVALFLAVVGIYGALAYTVSQRTREIGIRMAMGSDSGRIFKDVVARGLAVTGVGLVLGAVGAFVLTRLIQSLLFGVQPSDPRLMVGVAAILGLVGLLACLLPARRATSVDPVSALGG
jgi:predicted permease